MRATTPSSSKSKSLMAAKFHIAMFPWFAMGHLTPFLQLANKLAQKGHKISFIVPIKTESKLRHLNHHPDLISFHPITVPAVQGLPLGSETTADLTGFHQVPLLITAMDRTQPEVEQLLHLLKPHCIFHDFTHWLPEIASKTGVKTIYYSVISAAGTCYVVLPSRLKQLEGKSLQEMETVWMEPPSEFPEQEVKLHRWEAKALAVFGSTASATGLRFFDRLETSWSKSDAMAFKTCHEIEGAFVDCLVRLLGKPILLSGPLLPSPPPIDARLHQKLADWLSRQKPYSVIYCCLGSEFILEKSQFQELVLGLEATKFPFLAALKKPPGMESVAIALPHDFKERVGERGIVHGGWVQQPWILGHPSIGCFLTHCGWASVIEGLTNQCQLVLLPNIPDQIISARRMAGKLKVGVEVKKGDDGFFTKDSIREAVVAAMDVEKGVGKEIREGHAKLRETLLKENLEELYIDEFCMKLGQL